MQFARTEKPFFPIMLSPFLRPLALDLALA